MNDDSVFVKSDTGEVVTYIHRRSVIRLIKLLFMLDVITEKQVVDVAARFQSLFV